MTNKRETHQTNLQKKPQTNRPLLAGPNKIMGNIPCGNTLKLAKKLASKEKRNKRNIQITLKNGKKAKSKLDRLAAKCGEIIIYQTLTEYMTVFKAI